MKQTKEIPTLDQYEKKGLDDNQYKEMGIDERRKVDKLLKSQIDYEDCCKIDIFSLGVVLFNLAFEKFPYELDYSYKRNFGLILDKIKKQELKYQKELKKFRNKIIFYFIIVFRFLVFKKIIILNNLKFYHKLQLLLNKQKLI